MPHDEKGGLPSRPIPIAVVCHDTTESIALQLQIQVSRLVRTSAVDADMAMTLAPMIFGVLS